MMITSSEALRTSSSRIISSLVRAAKILTTRLPAALKARIIGNRGATPTPPPQANTVPTFSIWVALPNGPTKSVIYSPSSRLHNLVEETPIFWITSVIVPFTGSASEIVNGIRSPFSPTRTITKLPGFLDLAIKGASTTICTTFSEKYVFFRILFIFYTFIVLCYMGRMEYFSIPPFGDTKLVAIFSQTTL